MYRGRLFYVVKHETELVIFFVCSFIKKVMLPKSMTSIMVTLIFFACFPPSMGFYMTGKVDVTQAAGEALTKLVFKMVYLTYLIPISIG